MCKHNDYEPHSAPQKSELQKWDGHKWASSYKSESNVMGNKDNERQGEKKGSQSQSQKKKVDMDDGW